MGKRVRVGDEYIYRNNDETYIVTNVDVKVRINGEWIDGVEYRKKDAKDDKVYVTTLDDFVRRFKMKDKNTLVKVMCINDVVMEDTGELAYKAGKEYIFFCVDDDKYIGFDEIDNNPHVFYVEELEEYFDLDGLVQIGLDEYIDCES